MNDAAPRPADSAHAPPCYQGRFAPSPSGPLHFGSLIAATGSYLDARQHGGIWRVRMEDVDAPRTQPGAADSILRTLEAFGFMWDGPVMWQSQRLDAYAAALEQLKALGLAYGCACTRREIADSATHEAIDGGHAYPGTCRTGMREGKTARAWRLRVDNRPICFDDRIQGPQTQHLETDVGDFVLLRADGQYAYQLAVVVDDAEQGMTDVVRGADLLDSTPRQQWLQHCLGLPAVRYAHLPVAANTEGEKLSKQTLAPALQPEAAISTLLAALAFLGQQPPAAPAFASLAEVWAWADTHWQLSKVPGVRAIRR